MQRTVQVEVEVEREGRSSEIYMNSYTLLSDGQCNVDTLFSLWPLSCNAYFMWLNDQVGFHSLVSFKEVKTII